LIEQEQLVKQTLKGDRTAQEKLYKQFSGKMFAVCLRYFPDRMEAEDVLQEGFIKVFTHLQQYSGTGSLEGWVRRVIVNTALEKLRKKSFLFPLSDNENAVPDATSNHAFSNLGAMELLKLVRNLPQGYRVVFNLYAIEGYTHAEIANMLGISEGTSKSQLARARGTLQKMVRELYPSEYLSKIVNE
jgi:RNA polymerase sigma factor (sigma-70 family)